ncbi:MAG: MBL fold metallo-hydrolase, partial [Maricaulaceae bacterium]
IHVASANTDGDSIIHFVEPNVLHMGDTFFNGFFPYVDLAGGGSVEGYLGAADAGLSMADADTKIIPGHGPLATREDLEAFRAMMSGVIAAVRPLADQGMSVEEIVAANPLADYDAEWGQGFMNTETFTTIVATDLTSGM